MLDVRQTADLKKELVLPPVIPVLSVLLTSWGPWIVHHLSRLAPVWLPRAFVRLRAGEALLDGQASNIQTLSLWNDCWPELVQRHRVHWFDENLIPSHAPKGDSPALLDRLDTLTAQLHD